MKYILLCIITFLPVYSFAQTGKLLGIMPTQDGLVTYTDVVQVDGVAASELATRAKRWAATAYRSANDVIQFAEANTLIMKGTINLPYPIGLAMEMPGTVRHTLTIETKEGRYRYTLTSLFVTVQYTRERLESTIEKLPDVPLQSRHAKKYVEKIDPIIVSMLVDMRKAMATQVKDF